MASALPVVQPPKATTSVVPVFLYFLIFVLIGVAGWLAYSLKKKQTPREVTTAKFAEQVTAKAISAMEQSIPVKQTPKVDPFALYNQLASAETLQKIEDRLKELTASAAKPSIQTKTANEDVEMRRQAVKSLEELDTFLESATSEALTFAQKLQALQKTVQTVKISNATYLKWDDLSPTTEIDSEFEKTVNSSI